MALNLEQRTTQLGNFVAQEMGARTCQVLEVRRLTGGTVQENWYVDLDLTGGARPGRNRYVLRTAKNVGVRDSLTAAREYAVLVAVAAAGVAVPQPRVVCRNKEIVGQEFFMMDFAEGEGRLWKLQRDPAVLGKAERILEWIGEQVWRFQTVTLPNASLDFLGPQPEHTALEVTRRMREYLDAHDHPHPAIEYGIRWLECHLCDSLPAVLCHGDFRVGNMLVHEGRPEAILDWELAHWGDPYEDMAWLCMRFFRAGRPDLEGGGIGPRDALWRGYERASGRTLEPERIRYWDVMANVNWAVISLQQVERHTSGREDSLELALVGLATAEIELEALSLIDRAAKAEMRA